MEKKLLIDYFGLLRPILAEDTNGNLVAKGEFGFAGIPTENKRIYPKALWEREIKRIQQAISEGKVLGEIDHPADGKTSLKRVSHVMTGLEMTEDGKIIGTAKICKNAYGDQLRSIREAGGAIGVSSRGMGSTAMNEDGYEVVQDDYQYIVHDFVSDPAVKTSYPTFSTTESQEIKKETVMETKVESKKEETKPEVKTEAKAEAPAAQVTEAKAPEVKAEDKTPGTPVEQLAEEMKDRLAAQKKDLEEKHAKDVEALKESIKKELESDPKMVAGKIVLEDVAKLLRPVLLPEDVQAVVVEKDKKIAELEAVVESVKAEKKAVEEAHLVTAKKAHDFAMLYHFTTTLSEGDDRKAIRGIVGDPRKYGKHEELTEAVDGAKSALKKVLESKKSDSAELKALKESHEKALAESKKETAEAKKALVEAAQIARKSAIESYVLKRVKGNPNADKILSLCESAKNKAEADHLIEKFSVAAPVGGEYNSIRNRLNRIKNTTLVEEQLKDTGVNAKPESSKVVVEGVEQEMDGLFPGASLDLVRDLGGLQKN